MMRKLLTPRWIITTLLVIAAVGVMVRLGIWQLDRLQQRRAFNAQVEAQINAPALDLNKDLPADQLTGMQYRQVIVRGTYDPQNQVVLRNQVNDTLPGYHLLTPLHIEGSSESVLVDRGFISMDESKPETWVKYNQPGIVEVRGVILLPHVPQIFGVPDPTLAPGETRLAAWNSVNLERIRQQVPYKMLPVYVAINPGSSPAGMPVASVDQPDLSEGPHMGYAIQWFSFATVLALGYPFFVRKQLSGQGKPKKNTQVQRHQGKVV